MTRLSFTTQIVLARIPEAMAIFITGTGTDVGKTIFSSFVMARYARKGNLSYHKPVQTGSDSDCATVKRLSGIPDTFFIPGEYNFKTAASPHYAAEMDQAAIDTGMLAKRLSGYGDQKMLIELAGGIQVPLRRYYTNLDLMRDVGFPAVLVANTALGTINHTLLSWQALKGAAIECRGIFFVGEDSELCRDNIRTVIEMTGATDMGTFFLPHSHIAADEFQSLAQAFAAPAELEKLFT